MKIFGGTSNQQLTEEVCEYIGIEPGKMTAKTFSDGEIQIEVEENVRGKAIFIIQPTCMPVNDNLMQLLIITDAMKRASVESITAVPSYYGYGRQDRKTKPRVPISARLVADLITTAGADRVVSVDLHAGQIQGYFNIPVDNLFPQGLFLQYIRDYYINNLVIVSPDAGGVERARSYAKKLDAELAIIDKRRDAPNVAEAMNIIGDVEGKKAIILDDMVDTAGTLKAGAIAVKERGADEIFACATHPVLSGSAIEKIEQSPIKQVIVTNTIPLNDQAKQCKKIVQLSIAELLGEAIKRIYKSESVSGLFV